MQKITLLIYFLIGICAWGSLRAQAPTLPLTRNLPPSSERSDLLVNFFENYTSVCSGLLTCCDCLKQPKQKQPCAGAQGCFYIRAKEQTIITARFGQLLKNFRTAFPVDTLPAIHARRVEIQNQISPCIRRN